MLPIPSQSVSFFPDWKVLELYYVRYPSDPVPIEQKESFSTLLEENLLIDTYFPPFVIFL